MRTFHWNAPIIIGAGALAILLAAPASLYLYGAEPEYTGSVVIDTESAKQPTTFAELRAKLDGTDRAVALNALQVALTELGDGAELVWRRPSRELTGVIKPVSAFRDDEGRVCRRLTYSLSLDTYVRQVEGTACREKSGAWSLAG
jgi:17 kDa outer membrane surface antigen